MTAEEHAYVQRLEAENATLRDNLKDACGIARDLLDRIELFQREGLRDVDRLHRASEAKA